MATAKVRRGAVSRKVIFRLMGTQRKKQQGTDGGIWRWSAPAPRGAEVGTKQAEPLHCPPYGTSRPGHSTADREQRARKRQEATADQQWEEARQNARLRQMLSSGSSSEDEDEGQHGRWTLKFYEPP
jgi:hypothetical protein